MFKWLFGGDSLPVHTPATSWLVKPADWAGNHCVTAFWEDLPDHCFDCGTEAEETLSEPLNIEGHIQYMKVTKSCPKGCGRTTWIA
jgi:hypothetical protein